MLAEVTPHRDRDEARDRRIDVVGLLERVDDGFEEVKRLSILLVESPLRRPLP